jgi:hypothetical protein
MIGAFTAAPATDRRALLEPGFIGDRDRACLRLLYRSDVATTAQLVTLVYRRRQTAQERLARLYRAGYIERTVLPPATRGGAPLAFRVSARARRRLGYGPLSRGRAGTQLRHSLNVVETVCALVRADAESGKRLVQAWLTEPMATDLLARVWPDSVVALQTASGSGVLCLEIDEATEHAPVIRDKLERYGAGLRGKRGWHVLFVAGGADRAAALARTARQGGGRSELNGRVWATTLPDLRLLGLDAEVRSLAARPGRTALGAILADPRRRVCPTPVASDGWIRLLATGGADDLEAALR